jgi:hypothetical protein
MKSDIEYLTLLEKDLREAAKREEWKKTAPSTRRRRSSGIGWGAVAASVIGLLVVAGLIGVLVTNGGLGSSADEKAAASATPGGRTAFGNVGGASGATGSGGEAVVPATPPGPQVGDISKIIRDGSMSIQLDKDGFSAGFATVSRIARNNGGFVLSSQIRGQRRGMLVIRIPAKRFDDAMLALRSVGVVQAQSISGRDVTAQYIDLTARLQNAVGQRTVLRNLMGQATTIQETITVQNRLSQVELQIEQIQGQLNFIQNQVAEATVHVELHEKDAAQVETSAVENPSLGSAWDRSIQGFLNVVSAVVIGLGYLIPIAVLTLGIWLVTVAVRRRRGAS